MSSTSAVLLACTAATIVFPRWSRAQEFSAVMVDADAHGDTTRTPFYVGDGKVRWATIHGTDVTGGVILDLRRHTMTALDDRERTAYPPAGDDAASEMAELFVLMRPADPSDPCRGWNAAASSESMQASRTPHFTCRRLGSEPVGGRATDKWEITDVRTGKRSYAWLDPTLRYLVRLEDPGTGSVTEVRDIAEGRQPAALFTVPPGYRTLAAPPAGDASGVR